MNESLKGYLYVFGFAALVLLIIVGGILYTRWQQTNEQEQYRYNGFDFAKTQNGNLTIWFTIITVNGQSFRVPFYYHPSETEDVVLQSGLIQPFFFAETQPELIYLTLDPHSGSQTVLAGVEISRLTGERYGLLNIDTRSAFHTPVEGVDVPVITCEDAGDGTVVFFFEEGQENLIIQDTTYLDCFHFIYTDAAESIRVADRFAYGLLQIMPG